MLRDWRWTCGTLLALFVAFLGIGASLWPTTANHTAASVLFGLAGLSLLGAVCSGYRLWRQRESRPVLTISDISSVSGEEATFSLAPHGTLHANDIDLHRITLLNTAQDSEAKDVRVDVADSKPKLSVLPVRLHRMHDNTTPYTRVWPLAHDEPAKFDFIGLERAAKVLLLYRSDIGRTQYAFAVPTEEAVRLWKGGIAFKVTVRAASPAKGTDGYYLVSLDGNEELKVERITARDYGKRGPQS
jgi:hypothetical protein